MNLWWRRRRGPSAERLEKMTPEERLMESRRRMSGKHVRLEVTPPEERVSSLGRHVAADRASLVAGANPPTVRGWVAANTTVGRGYSYDWCRFRRNSHCYFSGVVDEEATQQAGYLVYVPMDRGNCWRTPWTSQQLCGSAQPGPNAKHEPRYLDATVPWESLGQRDYPTQISDRYAPPVIGAAQSAIGPGESPAAMAPGMPVATQAAAGTRWPPAPRTNPVLEPAVERPRALADLVQLRTGGYLAWNEFKYLRKRLGGQVGPVPLGGSDAGVSPGARLSALRELGVLSAEELEYLSARA
jgi:hypothetical protein